MGAGLARYGFASTCFLANSSEESDAPEAFPAPERRVVPPAPGRADQHAPPAGTPGWLDGLGADRAALCQPLHLGPRPPGAGAASGRRLAVLAARQRCF